MQYHTREDMDLIIAKIKSGAVFIYPTDTIYGIGCDATNSEAVERIRKLKQRPKMPFSVIAPGFPWIEEHCFINNTTEEYLKELPGRYTLIIPLRDEPVASNVLQGRNSLGIRMPQHWVRELAEKSRLPIVTTSVNVSGEPHLNSLDNIPSDFQVDFAIDEGKLEGSPSKVIDLSGEEPVNIR